MFLFLALVEELGEKKGVWKKNVLEKFDQTFLVSGGNKPTCVKLVDCFMQVYRYNWAPCL